MSKHTPGPWTAHHGWEIGGPCDEHPDWCEITGGSFKDGTHVSITGHIGIANARLIAAAPDMLEALKLLATPEGEELLAGCSDIWEQICAAIAKAEGRS